jgi:putative FmdB family regulatory protein
MPIYEYLCQACGTHHEAIRKISDPPLKQCPACGKRKLVRQLSAPVFRLKGGGWYETDFKSDTEAKRNLHADEKPDKVDAAGKEAPAKADAPDSKADTATAPKPEAKPEAAKPEPKEASRSSSAKSRRPARKPARKPPKRPKRR